MDGPNALSPETPRGRRGMIAADDANRQEAKGQTFPSGVNRSVARALSILTAVARSTERLSFADFQKQMNLPKATLHKLLGTLEALHFLERDKSSGRYSIGLSALELSAGSASRAADIRSIAAPILRRLVETYNETVNLGVLDGDEEILIERLDPPNQVVSLKIGWRHPAYGSSGGRACLAVRGDAIVAAMPERLKPLTENSIKTRRELEAHLSDVRQQGYVLDLEECYAGVRCVGVAVNVPGWPVYGLAFTLPLQRASVQHLHALAKPLLEAKAELERILAITPHP